MARPAEWCKHGCGAGHRPALSRGGMVMAKRLVVCCDGTWNFADQPSRTNVAKIALPVRPGSAAGKDQRVYYHSGVGTNRRERLRGGAFGVGLSRNVV